MTFEDGPFKTFNGLWQFKSLSDTACKLTLDLEFEFKSGTLAKLATGMFSGVSNNLVDSLCRRRADQKYKKGRLMTENNSQITVEVAYALPDKQVLKVLSVSEGTTALEAVEQSGIYGFFPEIDIASIQMGIFLRS